MENKTAAFSNKSKIKNLFLPVIFIAIFGFGFAGGYFYYNNYQKNDNYLLKSKYINFINDIYATIKGNYWKKMTDKELGAIFQKAAEKLTGKNILLEISNRNELEQEIYKIIKEKKTSQEKEDFVTSLANLVLVNLEPFGRSSLYSQEKEVELAEKVQNINPKTGKKEPTVSGKLFAYKPNPLEKKYSLPADVAYIKISRISPSTFEEFKKKADKISKENKKASSLIIDLRNNIGGSFDLLPYFLGIFIGKDQYAFELYHQGEKIPFKTKIGWLPPLFQYKKVVVLVNGKTQSSAEIMASVLKKYNVGVILGEKTKGWGTIEKVFPIKHQIDEKKKFSIFLVHSLTLRSDGQPIEGNGVSPVININDKKWTEKLYSYFGSLSLIKAIKTIYGLN